MVDIHLRADRPVRADVAGGAGSGMARATLGDPPRRVDPFPVGGRRMHSDCDLPGQLGADRIAHMGLSAVEPLDIDFLLTLAGVAVNPWRAPSLPPESRHYKAG